MAILVHSVVSVAAIVFLYSGIRGIYKELIEPLRKNKEATHWDQVNCSIISSELKELRSRGVRYWPEIIYEYEYNGEKHKSDNYSFWVTYAGRRRTAVAILERYKPAASTTCFVNPLNPNEAVLSGQASVPIVGIGIGILGNLFFVTMAAIILVCEIYNLARALD
ncbi:MAG: DUF3592 domain-containing protein [Planctomycetota bacterium]|jgi:hypothetical protein